MAGKNEIYEVKIPLKAELADRISQTGMKLRGLGFTTDNCLKLTVEAIREPIDGDEPLYSDLEDVAAEVLDAADIAMHQIDTCECKVKRLK